MPRRSAQRGWLGLIAVLIALVIVAVLAQTVLRSYGLLGGGERATASGRAQPAAAGAAAGDARRGAPAVTAPIERARALEGDLKRDAEDVDRRIDEQTQ
jgi:Tfp pilus assembly protein PilX